MSRTVHRYIILAVLAMVVPLAAQAQPVRKVARIAVLWGGPADFARAYVEAGRTALRELGYVEGRDFVVDYAFGERRPGAVDTLAADLVQRKVDVIVAAGDPAILAARRATATIPIVMVAAGDPVKSGFAKSLARPGGNATGMTFLSRELAAKRLEVLKEIVPSLGRLGILWNPDSPGAPLELDAVQAAAEALALGAQPFAVRGVPEIDRAFAAMAERRVQAVAVLTDPVTATTAGRVVCDAGLKHRLPLVCELREFAAEGCLVSYGPSLLSMARGAAFYVDKILKGARPADLPVEQPTKFQLTVNLKTATALGLTVPQAVLLRADEVIQ